MVLLVDDVLALPGTFGKIIFNTLIQTVQKVSWVEYVSNLKKILLQARHDFDEAKITQEKYQEVEKFVFKEMKIAKRYISGK